MRAAISLLLALSSTAYAAGTPRYLESIWQRWDASDLVCTGVASAPVRTGTTRTIDGSNRDQLSSEATLETCFKGNRPVSSPVRVVGYSLTVSKDISEGYLYAGPPPGFVRKGRNLLFLRQTVNPGQFEIAVPIYETAIRLADSRSYYPNDASATSVRFALTQEFEAAIVQFDANDLSDIGRIFDLLGNAAGIAELSRFSKSVPPPIQRDIAVALVVHDQLEYEPLAISLLTDASALGWKRANAASALGEHGTERALPYLRQVASEPATTDDLKQLHVWALSAFQRLERRLAQRRNGSLPSINGNCRKIAITLIDSFGPRSYPASWREPSSLAGLWSILWNGFHIWKQFRLFSTRGSYTLPIRPHGGRSGIVPPWYATHYGSISGDWRSELEKNATARAIQDCRTRPMNRSFGKRRRRGQQNSPRGRPTLPVCSARQEKACGCAHTRQCNCLFVNRHCRTYHIYGSRRAVRGSFE